MTVGEFTILLIVVMLVLGPGDLARHLDKARAFARDLGDSLNRDNRTLVATAFAILAAATIYCFVLALRTR